nr:hypothetical protein Itr_chr03CG13180 [Ipomoea trifida]
MYKSQWHALLLSKKIERDLKELRECFQEDGRVYATAATISVGTVEPDSVDGDLHNNLDGCSAHRLSNSVIL